MTAGALLQLKNGNVPRMGFLVSNPQISHFKSVYRKYTNFSTQYISVLPQSSANLSKETEVEVKFKIPRDSDLINDIYFTFELPDIYSRNSLNFQWIRRIGEYIIKEVKFTVGSQEIDKQYGEYLHIWSELNLSKDQKDGYNRMIGNVTEVFDPESVTGHAAYPGSATGTALAYPSIVGRKIFVPLHFYFNQHVSNSFPLIAVQYDEMNINFTLRPLQELYTIIEGGYRRRPSSTDHDIGRFFSFNSLNNDLYINPRLEIKNIFLDNEERKRFALQSHEYLGLQVQRELIEGRSTNFDIDLKNINKPIKQLHFIIRRSDFEDLNLWSNFTNWYFTDIPIYSGNHPTTYTTNPTVNSTTIKYYKTLSLVKSAELRLDTHSIVVGNPTDFTGAQESLEGKENSFFNLIQNYKSSRSMPEEGIYTIAFNLDDYNTRQPNGVSNFSNYSTKELRLFLNEIHNNTYDSSNYNYNIMVFAENYEIIKFMGGLVGTATSN